MKEVYVDIAVFGQPFDSMKFQNSKLFTICLQLMIKGEKCACVCVCV